MNTKQQPVAADLTDDLCLIQTILQGYPKSMASVEALNALRRVNAALGSAPATPVEAGQEAAAVQAVVHPPRVTPEMVEFQEACVTEVEKIGMRLTALRNRLAALSGSLGDGGGKDA